MEMEMEEGRGGRRWSGEWDDEEEKKRMVSGREDGVL
jgi:hypothetical protein